jgi:hypothetical protein
MRTAKLSESSRNNKEFIKQLQCFNYKAEMYNLLGPYKRSQIKSDFLKDIMISQFGNFLKYHFNKDFRKNHVRDIFFLPDDYFEIKTN